MRTLVRGGPPGHPDAGVLLYGLGLNWVIFNIFIGLVKSGVVADVVTRSVLDVVAMNAGAAMGLVEHVHSRRVAA